MYRVAFEIKRLDFTNTSCLRPFEKVGASRLTDEILIPSNAEGQIP